MIEWKAELTDAGRQQWSIFEYEGEGPAGYRRHVVSGLNEADARRIAKLPELEAAVAKMSHRRCWECEHVAYYLDATIPACRCEECGSADTRRIWTAAELAGKEVKS
jgi:hypothetical protein